MSGDPTTWLNRYVAEYHRYRAQQRKARWALGNAVRDGRVIKATSCLCGETRNIEGHHPDYSKPLEVEWCCRRCHRARHRERFSFLALMG